MVQFVNRDVTRPSKRLASRFTNSTHIGKVMLYYTLYTIQFTLYNLHSTLRTNETQPCCYKLQQLIKLNFLVVLVLKKMHLVSYIINPKKWKNLQCCISGHNGQQGPILSSISFWNTKI